WIKGMKEHDYAGAGHMAELVKNTFGWDVTRSSSVSDGVWKDIFETYVKDKYDLGLREWFDKVNPHAMQELTATMLEAARKGYWNADQATLDEIAKVYAESVAKDGPSAGLVSGGNEKLEQEVLKHLAAPGDAALVAAFRKAVEQSKGGQEPEAARVRGPVLEEQKPQPVPPAPEQPSDDSSRWIAVFAVAGLTLLFVAGLLIRPGNAES
ncbi:MAG: cobaltochelatase subunit CobN, partial [Planctomycetes bacterium]|nr:cobaltochelatase subunit CobN [Planctomycetota bacterium]